MEVKKDNIEGYDSVTLIEENKQLQISFAPNLDLYWCFRDGNDDITTYGTFLITKENYQIYELFEQLYSEIASCQVFDDDGLNEIEKQSGQYKELFNDEVITWISDDRDLENDNIVKMSKQEETFLLEFAKKEKKKDIQNLWDMSRRVSIRFRNSGSSYAPFNIPFMRMFNKLCEYDPEFHQINIEEYLYQKSIKKC